MGDITVTIPIITILGAACGCVAWTAKLLWKLDRRVLRLETHLNLDITEEC